MMGRPHHVLDDCPEPAAFGAFDAPWLGLPVTHRSPDVVVVSHDDTTSGDAFRGAADRAVRALGATPLGGNHVYADPAGHPFCVVARPGWAPPVIGPTSPDPRRG